AAGHARADFGGQRFGDLPARIVGERGFAQLRGGVERGLRDAGGLLRRGGQRNEQGKQQRRKAHGGLRLQENPELSARRPGAAVPQVMPLALSASASRGSRATA